MGNNYQSTRTSLHFTAMNCKVHNRLKKCEEIYSMSFVPNDKTEIAEDIMQTWHYKGSMCGY